LQVNGLKDNDKGRNKARAFEDLLLFH